MAQSLWCYFIEKGVKRAHSPMSIPNHHQDCSGVQRHDNISGAVCALSIAMVLY